VSDDPASEPAATARTPWQRIRRHPLFHFLVALAVLALVQAFFVKLYQVPSASMEPTLHVDGAMSDRFLVNRLAYLGGEPEVGDVVVFSRPDSWGESPEHGLLRTMAGAVGDVIGIGPSNQDPLVKRVLARGGDTLECCGEDGRLLLNGEPLDEPYVASDHPFEAGVTDCASTPAASRCFPPIEVPEGQLLVMGDNRANSSDSVSRCRGGTTAEGCARFVPVGNVVGEAFAVVFPPSGWGRGLSVDERTTR
jgi:signal peptidase I